MINRTALRLYGMLCMGEKMWEEGFSAHGRSPIDKQKQNGRAPLVIIWVV